MKFTNRNFRSVRVSYYANMLSRVNGVKSLPYLSNYVKYKLSKKEAIINVRKYLPQIAHFLIIKKCNLSCDFCSAAQALYDGRGQNWKDTKADINKIKRISIIPMRSYSHFF